MKLTSCFENGDLIGKQYTGEGSDQSPPVTWSDVPVGTRSFALICDDPDAPSPQKPAADPWVHWVIYNIPADVDRLPEGVSRAASPQEIPGANQGCNSWPQNNIGFRGPMPPPGSGRHRYFFRLYALDTGLQLDPTKANKTQLLAAIEGHVLAEAQLMGTYQRG